MAAPGDTPAPVQDLVAVPDSAPPLRPATPAVAIQAPEERAPPSELLASYGREISATLARYKEYPRIAQMRGWEGSVIMRLHIAQSGRVLDAELYASSGHELLDKQALAMARRAGQLPLPPRGLAGDQVAVLVPVVFRLER